jgi:putative transposase
MCRVYGVTRAGYYAWRGREPSAHALSATALVERIREVHRASRHTYGSPRVHRELRAAGEPVGRHRVARLMQRHGIKARSARLYRSNPGQHAFFASIPNRQLEVLANEPNRVWVGDITYLRVGGAWRYLAVVMDKCSRRIVGASSGPNKDARLTLRALNCALRRRRPPAGLVFHSDRGIEYAANAFRARLASLGIVQSMNRPNEMNDNAHMESFFHSMKSDVIHGVPLTSRRMADGVIRGYLPFYNGVRLHSSLDYVPPDVYEQRFANSRVSTK